MIFTAMKST